MQYEMPQFIEIEDKVVGPFTFRQFVYLAGGAGLSYIVFTVAGIFLPNYVAFVLVIPVAIFALALAFYKVNSRPFIYTVEFAVKYYLTSKLYLWKKEQKKAQPSSEEAAVSPLTVPRISDSKLKDLSWSLDVKENENPVTPPDILNETAHAYAHQTPSSPVAPTPSTATSYKIPEDRRFHHPGN